MEGYDYGARYYLPQMGTWMSADSVTPDNVGEFNGFQYVASNPLSYRDPTGHWVETLWDGANVLMGVKDTYAAVKEGRWLDAAVSGGGVILDTAAVVLPGIPGGAGTVIRTGRAADKALDAASAVRHGDEAVDVVRQTASRGGDATRTADKSNDARKAADASKGRAGKQTRLKGLVGDDKLGSADRGWIQQDINQIERSKRTRVRNPPGKDLAHERGREAAKGYGYEHSNLQDRDLHRLQHKYDGYGRKNKERPPE
jgi:hypothetical protein